MSFESLWSSCRSHAAESKREVIREKSSREESSQRAMKVEETVGARLSGLMILIDQRKNTMNFDSAATIDQRTTQRTNIDESVNRTLKKRLRHGSSRAQLQKATT